MPPANSHLAASGSTWKVPDGPTMGPKAGPTLDMEVAAAEKAPEPAPETLMLGVYCDDPY